MSDIKLFSLRSGVASEIKSSISEFEKPIQNLIESNLEALLGIRFLKSEHSTGKSHGGRIDSLGVDENNCPVIVEYKKSSNENIINQGLFYLDWLMNNRAEFKLLVLETFGQQTADKIDWTAPRVICIAGDFTRYDSHAVQQISRNIELIRYRQFGSELLLLELVNTVGDERQSTKKPTTERGGGTDKTVAEHFSNMPPTLRAVFDSLADYTQSLGDDVQRKDLKLYVAFKRLRNFATVCFQKNNLLAYLHIDPASVTTREGFARDVRDIGHWGTGDLELTVKTLADLDEAKPLIRRAYEGGNSRAP
jgi:predicted transport protein